PSTCRVSRGDDGLLADLDDLLDLVVEVLPQFVLCEILRSGQIADAEFLELGAQRVRIVRQVLRRRRSGGHPVAKEGPAVIEREPLGGRDRQCTDRPAVVRVLQVRIPYHSAIDDFEGFTNVLFGVAALLVGVFTGSGRALVREEIPISSTREGEDRQHERCQGAPLRELGRGRSVRGRSRGYWRGGMRAGGFGDVLGCGRWLMCRSLRQS